MIIKLVFKAPLLMEEGMVENSEAIFDLRW
jgi:hypothetical protein